MAFGASFKSSLTLPNNYQIKKIIIHLHALYIKINTYFKSIFDHFILPKNPKNNNNFKTQCVTYSLENAWESSLKTIQIKS